MGFLNWLLQVVKRALSQQPVESSAGNSSAEGTQSTVGGAAQLQAGAMDDWVNVEYGGQRYHCQVEESPNGVYQAAYADGRTDEDGPIHGIVFLFENGTHVFAKQIERPNAVAVSNSGDVSVVDWEFGWGEELSGTFHVFDQSGAKQVVQAFDSNLGPCDVTADGRYAAVSTLNPDCSTYIFDVRSGELLARHENEGGNKQGLDFQEADDGWWLGLCDSPRDDPAYAIDVSGAVVWRNQDDNRRGDVEELVKQVQRGEGDHTVEQDLCAVAQQSPSDISPHLSTLLDLVEQGAFQTVTGPGGDVSVTVDTVFTAVARENPGEYEPYLDRLIANIRGATTLGAAVVSAGVVEELADQDAAVLESKFGELQSLLQAESRAVRQRAVSVIESDVSRMYNQDPDIAEQLTTSLQSETDLAVLRDLTTALTTLLDERPETIVQMEPVVPRAIELLSLGDGDYQYGDVESYDYKDQTHYDTNHLHRTAPSLIAALAPEYADELSQGIPRLLVMIRQPGQRNTSLRSGAHRALTAIVEHSTGEAQAVLESEFKQIVDLLKHSDSEVQTAAVELLVVLGTADAREELTELQGHDDEELAVLAGKGLRAMDAAVAIDLEVAKVSPSGGSAIERQLSRYSIQRAYEFLQAEGSARKQMFIDEVYADDSETDTDQWWRTVRAGLKSLETVELSGNTYSYTASE